MRTVVRSVLLLWLLAVLPGHGAVVLTLAHIMAPDHPRAKACARFAETVRARSGGRIKVEVYGAASAGDSETILRAMQNGSLDLSPNSQGAVAEVIPEFNAIMMPFLFADSAAASRVLNGPVGKLLAEKAEAKGFVVLGYWDSGMRYFTNSVRPLRKPADFAGLRFRVQPRDLVSIDIVRALGGKPVEIKYSELYNGLQDGLVDGQENPFNNVVTAKLYEVQKHLSLTGHSYTVSPFLMRRGAWEALSADDRALIKAAAEDAARYQSALTQQLEANALQFLNLRGMSVEKVDRRLFLAATAAIYDKWYRSPIGDTVRAMVKAAKENQ